MSGTRIVTRWEIREVDPHDTDAVTAWHTVVAAVYRHELGDHAAHWTLPELVALVRKPRKRRRDLLFLGVLDGKVAAAGLVGLPLLDNLGAADVEVTVLPAQRRRGLGTAMLQHVEDVAREHGRSRFDAVVGWPHDGPPDGAGTPGVEFGRVHDYVLGLGDVQRELELPVDDALLERLAAEAGSSHEDYLLRTWTGPVPDDIVHSWLALSTTLATEAPTGSNEHEDDTADIEAHRQSEMLLEKQGRTRFHAAALDGDGTVVAYTDLVVSTHDPRWIQQWGTLVRRDHRGHRLGLALKVANLRALQASGLADGRRVVTWNADVNDHMIAINERLGFRPTARGGELQKKLRNIA
jgi:GNAT superfamily N-acetyltransferase